MVVAPQRADRRRELERAVARQLAGSSERLTRLWSVSDDDRVLAQVRDPEGRLVVLLERIWADKIAFDHPELAGYESEVLGTVSGPDHVEPTRGRVVGATTVAV